MYVIYIQYILYTYICIYVYSVCIYVYILHTHYTTFFIFHLPGRAPDYLPQEIQRDRNETVINREK